jgi:hypothetical protein
MPWYPVLLPSALLIAWTPNPLTGCRPHPLSLTPSPTLLLVPMRGLTLVSRTCSPTLPPMSAPTPPPMRGLTLNRVPSTSIPTLPGPFLNRVHHPTLSSTSGLVHPLLSNTWSVSHPVLSLAMNVLSPTLNTASSASTPTMFAIDSSTLRLRLLTLTLTSLGTRHLPLWRCTSVWTLTTLGRANLLHVLLLACSLQLAILLRMPFPVHRVPDHIGLQKVLGGTSIPIGFGMSPLGLMSSRNVSIRNSTCLWLVTRLRASLVCSPRVPTMIAPRVPPMTTATLPPRAFRLHPPPLHRRQRHSPTPNFSTSPNERNSLPLLSPTRTMTWARTFSHN